MNISLAAESLFRIGSFSVTNSLVVAWLVTIFLGLVAVTFKLKKLNPVPKGFQNFIEAIIDGALSFATSVTGSRATAMRFLPLPATIFFFVLFSNWFGLLPGVGSIGLMAMHEGRLELIPFFRSASADLNGTIAIALVSVLGTQLFGILTIGVWKHAGKYFNFHNPILFFVGLLELVGELARIMSFSFRLFGNVFAGEVLLIVVSALVPYLAPLPFLFLEVFVGMVQALVFALLTLVFTTIASAEHEH